MCSTRGRGQGTGGSVGEEVERRECRKGSYKHRRETKINDKKKKLFYLNELTFYFLFLFGNGQELSVKRQQPQK